MRELLKYRLIASVILVPALAALAALAAWSPIGGVLKAVTGPPEFDHSEYVTCSRESPGLRFASGIDVRIGDPSPHHVRDCEIVEARLRSALMFLLRKAVQV